MNAHDLTVDRLYSLKRRLVITVLVFLAVIVTVTMFFIAHRLRTTLENDSRVKTRELGTTVTSNLRHLMMLRVPEMIQDTLEKMAGANVSIVRTFIVDNKGRIAYSSETGEIGRVIDRFEEQSCRICHKDAESPPKSSAVLLDLEGSVQRNITLIYNEPQCHECHSPLDGINGKLIIDRSMESTTSLVTSIELIIFGAGGGCLLILLPIFSRILSRGIDRYILEIFQRNEELRLLYVMVERLSKTLNMDLLKEIVVEIFKDVLAADQVTIVLPRGQDEFSASRWSADLERTERYKIEAGTPFGTLVETWQQGRMAETDIAKEGGYVSMPLEKNGHRLALVVVEKTGSIFDPMRLKLVNIIRSHVTVAFENARLYYIAITDELTGLYTKRHFRTCIDKEFSDFQAYGNKLSLLMVDLDDFKKVNDAHGHVAGDVVLKEVGNRILASIRENDMAFRYGGEEFAVLLPSTGASGGVFVAERIRTALSSELFEPGNLDLSLSASIGISTCPGPKTIRDLIVEADQALYQAKRSGKNRVILAPPSGTESSEGLTGTV